MSATGAYFWPKVGEFHNFPSPGEDQGVGQGGREEKEIWKNLEECFPLDGSLKEQE